jgi:hypothetical protein
VSCSSPEFALVRPGQLRKGENVLVVDLTTDETREMAVMLKIRIPRLKVLFVAGPATPMAEPGGSGLVRAFAPADRHFLRKPFTGNELLMKLDALLAVERDKAVRTAGAA